MPPDRRKYLLGRDRPRLVHWGFSDAYIVAAPVLRDSDGDMAVAVHDIHRIMYAAARMWLFSLDGAPIRGGIEMGLLAGIPPHDEPRELSGPALVRAYWLESQVAGHPRVMVGSACIRFLDDIAHGRVSGSSDEAIAGAEACLGLLCEASQEHWTRSIRAFCRRKHQTHSWLSNFRRFVIVVRTSTSGCAIS